MLASLAAKERDHLGADRHLRLIGGGGSEVVADLDGQVGKAEGNALRDLVDAFDGVIRARLAGEHVEGDGEALGLLLRYAGVCAEGIQHFLGNANMCRLALSHQTNLVRSLRGQGCWGVPPPQQPVLLLAKSYLQKAVQVAMCYPCCKM